MAFPDPVIVGEQLLRTGIRSNNFVAGQSGWRIGVDGSAQFADIVILGSGQLSLASANYVPDVSGWAINTDGTAQFAGVKIIDPNFPPGTIQTGDIADGAITGDKIPDDTITKAKVDFDARLLGANISTPSNTAPSNPLPGDLWLDTGNGNLWKQWNGTTWTPYQSGQGAIANGAIGAAQISFTARTIGSNIVTTSGTAPSSPLAGDLWIDTGNGNLIKRYDGTAWQPNPIGTAAIQLQAITSALIASQTIVAGNIATGAITTPLLAAGAATIDKLVIGGPHNAVPDPNFTNAGINAVRKGTSATTFANGVATNVATGRFWLIGDRGQAPNDTPGPTGWVPVQAGQLWNLSIMTNQNAASSPSFRVVTMDASGVTTLATHSQAVPTGVDTNVTWTFTIPADAVAMQVGWNQNAGKMWNPSVYVQTSGVLIQDGSITVSKIPVGELTGDRLADLTVPGSKIASTTITGDKIASFQIQTNHLIADGSLVINGKFSSTPVPGGGTVRIDNAGPSSGWTGNQIGLFFDLGSGAAGAVISSPTVANVEGGLAGIGALNLKDQSGSNQLVLGAANNSLTGGNDYTLLSGAGGSSIRVGNPVFASSGGIQIDPGNGITQIYGRVSLSEQAQYAILGSSTGTSVPNNTWTDVNNWVGQGVGPTDGITRSVGTFTVPHGGVFLLNGQVQSPTGWPSGSRFLVRFLKNGTDSYGQVEIQTNGQRQTIQSTTILAVSDGDTISFQVFQATGATQTLSNAVGQQTYAAMRLT